MTGGSEKQSSSRCSIVSRSSRRPDLPAGRLPRAGEVKEGRRPARRRRALSLTGLSTVAPFLRSRRRKRLDAEHGISCAARILAAVRQKLHLSRCSDFQSQLLGPAPDEMTVQFDEGGRLELLAGRAQ